MSRSSYQPRHARMRGNSRQVTKAIAHSYCGGHLDRGLPVDTRKTDQDYRATKEDLAAFRKGELNLSGRKA
jgi:hypothetical protein